MAKKEDRQQFILHEVRMQMNFHIAAITNQSISTRKD